MLIKLRRHGNAYRPSLISARVRYIYTWWNLSVSSGTSQCLKMLITRWAVPGANPKTWNWNSGIDHTNDELPKAKLNCCSTTDFKVLLSTFLAGAGIFIIHSCTMVIISSDIALHSSNVENLYKIRLYLWITEVENLKNHQVVMNSRSFYSGELSKKRSVHRAANRVHNWFKLLRS